jgi:outer membrane protein OmpA-like peptidoglycan-associated protein
VGGCDLYGATLEGARWTMPKSLGPVVNSTSWDGQPSLSPDGDTLIFASRRPGGVGKSDLWMSKRDASGAWGAAQNLGEPVNTPFSEQSPALAPDGKTLFFASAGHPGMGRMDIFRTVLSNGRWSEPVNLGAPLNSEQDDKFFTVGGAAELGFFASKREGGMGGYDLYSIAMPDALRPEATLVVSGTVTDAKTGAPMEADLLIEDLAGGNLVSKERSNSATGKYVVVLPEGRTYSVSVSRAGYFFFSSKFAVPKGSVFKELAKNLRLQPIVKGAHAVLNNVFFETNRAELGPDSQLELDKAVELMRKNPKLVFEVGGHTDNVGKADANLTLSAARARVVREHLVANGIAEPRLRARGFGQTVPVGDNKTEDGRQANRRTELVVLSD